MGIDPGSRVSGIGVVRNIGSKLEHIEHFPIKIPPKLQQTEKLVYFAENFEKVIAIYPEATLVIESLFTAKNVRSILTLSHIRGVAMMLAGKNGMDVVEVPPATVKLSVAGYGRATKEQVQFMVQKILRLQSVPKPDDCADALAMAICYLSQSRLMKRIRNTR